MEDIEFKPGQDITIMGNKFRVISTFKDWDNPISCTRLVTHISLVYFTNHEMKRICLTEKEIISVMDKDSNSKLF